MDIKIKIEAPELAYAIVALAEAISKNLMSSSLAREPEAPVATAPAPAPAPTVLTTVPQPVAAVAQPVAAVPVMAITSQSFPAQDPVPTQAQTYTMEQLAVAATQLVDAGRRAELVQLLAAFGVQALMVLPKEQYGNFATALRSMGAKI